MEAIRFKPKNETVRDTDVIKDNDYIIVPLSNIVDLVWNEADGYTHIRYNVRKDYCESFEIEPDSVTLKTLL